METGNGGAGGDDAASRPAGETVRRAARRFLRRLSEPGAFLIIAEGARKAGIFCAANAYRRPIAMLPAEIAVEFLRQEWIAVASRGEASVRYRITEIGRSFLKRELAEEESARRASGSQRRRRPFWPSIARAGERLFADPDGGEPATLEVNLGESPVGWLARRKGPDGRPFLAPEEVDAAEKLRADFEAAQIGPSVAQDWRKFPDAGRPAVPARRAARVPARARPRRASG